VCSVHKHLDGALRQYNNAGGSKNALISFYAIICPLICLDKYPEASGPKIILLILA
jgi:hypothetical protein